jgi:transposase
VGGASGAVSRCGGVRFTLGCALLPASTDNRLAPAVDRIPGSSHGLTDRVVIAVDPHKASWTTVIVNQQCQPRGSLRLEVNRGGYRRLRQLAQDWPKADWAIEAACGLGAPLAQKLADEGIECLDVPAKLALRMRMPSTGHGRNNDEAHALSVGIAALTSTGLRSVRTDETAQVLRTLTEYRDDLIRTRTRAGERRTSTSAKLARSVISGQAARSSWS